jgi:hypothetical protein
LKNELFQKYIMLSLGADCDIFDRFKSGIKSVKRWIFGKNVGKTLHFYRQSAVFVDFTALLNPPKIP